MISDYLYADSIGTWIKVEATPEFVTSIQFIKDNTKRKKNKITLSVSKDLLRYFNNQLKEFPLHEVDISDFTPFQWKVLTTTRNIPWGTSVTYSQLARMVGRPRAIRAVGNALSKNRVPVIIPCHRVVSRNGVGGFSCGLDIKKKLLQLESIKV
jgi:methylated-DNA-[protein]-cysteine S-methyltransferase